MKRNYVKSEKLYMMRNCYKKLITVHFTHGIIGILKGPNIEFVKYHSTPKANNIVVPHDKLHKL